uniref:Uncharacterized protein n=1 Tax=Timema poppense TaxID=170557 RepID=A0A7R9H124_TIMPO|nr:unnamed protein product [Timema poppensis]
MFLKSELGQNGGTGTPIDSVPVSGSGFWCSIKYRLHPWRFFTRGRMVLGATLAVEYTADDGEIEVRISVWCTEGVRSKTITLRKCGYVTDSLDDLADPLDEHRGPHFENLRFRPVKIPFNRPIITVSPDFL